MNTEAPDGITPEGRAPMRRFIKESDRADGNPVMTHVKGFTCPGNPRDDEKAMVESMLRHAPPYKRQDLVALGMENMPNSTMGELPRRVAEEERKWVEFVTSSSGLWAIRFDGAPPEMADALESLCGEILNDLWSSEPSTVVALQLAFRQFATWGIGPLVWTDCHNPVPVARTATALKFPSGTRITLDNFTECTLDDSCSPQDLWAALRVQSKLPGSEGKEKAHGWKNAEVLAVLKHHSQGNGINSPWFDSMEAMELHERQGNYLFGEGPRDIELKHVFIKEYDDDGQGRCISQLTLAQNGKGWRIIRDRGRYYESVSQFLVLATDRVGSDGTISGLRGMGLDLRENARSMDILHNGGMFATFRSSVPVYSFTGNAPASDGEQIVVGPNGVFLENGMSEVQSYVNPAPAFAMLDRLSGVQDRQQNTYDINAPNKRSVQRTAKEATFDATKANETTEAQILPITRLFFAPLGAEFARRLVAFPRDKNGNVLKFPGWRIAQAFWDRVRFANLPVEQLLQLRPRVVMNPTNSPGGLDAKVIKSEAAWPALPYLNTQKQRNAIINQRLTGIFGFRAAAPMLNRDEDERLAPDLQGYIDSENADLTGGQRRNVFADQDHIRHLGPLNPEGFGHVPEIMRLAQELQQGASEQFTVDPLESMADKLRSAVAFKAHVDAHLEFAGRNPALIESDAVQPYFDFASQMESLLLKIINLFQQAVEKRQQESGTNVDPKVAAIMAKAQAEIQVMQMKTQAEIKNNELKTMSKLANNQLVTDARRDNKGAEFAVGQQIRKLNAESDLALERSRKIVEMARPKPEAKEK